MNQKMNGDNELKTAEQRLDGVLEKISEWESNLGLIFTGSNEVVKYLNLEIDDINNMDSGDCFNASWLLSQEASFIQMQINRQEACRSWCEWNLRRTIAARVNHFDQYTSNKRELAIRENAFAQAIDKLLQRAVIRIKSLEDMPKRLTTQADRLTNIGFAKQREERQ